MENYYSESTPLRAAVREMEAGDFIKFPVNRLSVLRSTISAISVELDRKYETKLNRPDKTVDVKRVS